MNNETLKRAMPYPAELDDCPDELIDQGADALPAIANTGLKTCKTPEELITALANWYRATESRLGALKHQYDEIRSAMEADEKHLQRKLDFIGACISSRVPTDQSLVNDYVKIAYRKSVACKIEHPGNIPFELLRVKHEPDIAAIKARLLAGEEIEGAYLETRYHLQISEGGPRAIDNAKKAAKKKDLELQPSTEESTQTKDP